MEANDKFICLDVGTTTIKCLIIDSTLKLLGSAFDKVEILYPEVDCSEIDPQILWESILSVVNHAMYDAKITAANVKSLGICTQRNSFITWKKDTGEPFHNFITWKDLRTRRLVEKLNSSAKIKSIRFGSYLLYLLTRNPRYLAASRLKLTCAQVSARLLWVLENIPGITEEIKKNNVMFGTLDTWLVYKLTANLTYVTDISNASSTGLYDPFVLDWGIWTTHILKIPREILPPVVDNDYEFGTTTAFGPPITISAIISDQSASMLGSYCFDQNDLKMTIGTGSFIDLNTGSKIDCKLDGMYPIVAWRLQRNLVYLTEAPCFDGGSLIEWLKVAGYIKDVADLNRIINQSNTEGQDEELYFIPAFSGLGPPINDDKAASGFIGIQPTTTADEMVLAVLKSITYRIGLAFRAMKFSSNDSSRKICIDGGVSKNDFICQIIANLTEFEVERGEFTEVAALGVSFACGLSSGIWKDTKELKQMKTSGRTFKKDNKSEKYKINMEKWRKAADRFKLWYS